MKARLAKKIASRPLDKLPSYWLKKLGKDRRIDEAIKLHEKLKTKQKPKTYEQ